MRFKFCISFFVLTVSLLSAQEPVVTYIANEGFIVASGQSKVGIDVMFKKEIAAYHAPTDAMMADIRDAAGVFADLDWLLVTHAHRDHFNADLVGQYMKSNRQCRFIGPPQAVEKLKTQPCFKDIESRVYVVASERGDVFKALDSGDLQLQAWMLKHAPYFTGEVNKHEAVENCVYLFTVGGSRFLHTGDASFDWNADILPDVADPIDVLFIQHYDVSEKSRQIVSERIRPRQIVGMHIPPAHFNQCSGLLKASYGDVKIFNEPGEVWVVSLK